MVRRSVHMKSRIIIVVLAALLAARAFAQESSLAAVRTDVERGDHRAALTKISRMLSSTAGESQPGERYQLLMLKAECQLQLKDRIGSVTTFKSAAKAAGNLVELASARANALIIYGSSSGEYKPPNAVGEPPIDILNVDSRKGAMARMQREVWTKHKNELEQAMRADTLPPIERVFVAVADAYFLELGATGEAKQTGQTMRDLGTRAYRLMRDEASRYARQVDQLGQLANSTDAFGRWGGARRGLMPADRNELRDTIAYLGKMQGRAREYREVAARLEGDGPRWDSLVAEITDALFEAQSLAEQG